MKLHRLLAAGLVVSVAAHAAGSAVFAPDSDDIEIAASDGGAVAFVGSLEDLVSGADTPLAAVEPAAEEPEQPVETAQALAPLEPAKTAAEALLAEINPVVRGVTEVRPITAATLSAVRPEPAPTAPAASAEEPAEVEQNPLAEAPPVTPGEPSDAKPVLAETVAPPIKPVETVEAAPVEARVAEAKPAETKEAPRELRKQKPKRMQKRGAKHSARKGGERKASANDTSNAQGRKGATAQDGGDEARSNYNGRVLAKLRRAKRYPREARRNKLEGTATVSFAVARDGAVTGIRLQRSSGHEILDAAALDVVRRAAPMPAIPGQITRNDLRFTVPIRFSSR